jgi:flavodoxin
MKTLVAYFSATGTTKQKAEQLAKKIGADLYEIEPKVKYTKEDLDWMNKKVRSSIEGKDEHIRPELKEEKLDLDGYDEIYLGFPIWWYRAPNIIYSFIEHNDLEGKIIHLFMTSGGSSISNAQKQLKKAYPNLNID